MSIFIDFLVLFIINQCYIYIYIYMCVFVCVFVCVCNMMIDLVHNACEGGASGVVVIVAGIGHGDTSSNPGLIAFHIALIPLGKV